ncbi:TetR/AcrR family transcriptional regulator [Desulforegula conservatrix]|uniref:TetR/AcrR family transcriptional regulator n=1 Tax=Desulforegula conservatrix TaxID=153026 RepID=UPI0004111814|nr:TetR/AcrR family transcriptional regulator [Desulforegula conservatrix]
MSLEKLDTETRKKQIASAAFEIIALKGTKGLSISGISKKIGLVPSAIYRHFKSKEEILDAVIDLVKEGLTGIAKEAGNEERNPIDQLRRLVALHAGFIMSNKALPRIMFSEDVIAGKNHRRDKVYEAQSAYITEIGEIISSGQKTGEIRPEIDPSAAAVMFIGIVLPAGIFWHMSSEQFDMLKQVEASWKMYLSAIKA